MREWIRRKKNNGCVEVRGCRGFGWRWLGEVGVLGEGVEGGDWG